VEAEGYFGADFGLTRLSAGLAFFAGLPFASTIRTNLSKFSKSDADGFGIVILVRGRIRSLQTYHGATVINFGMPWYRIALSRDDIAAEKYVPLQASFEALYRIAGSPRDAAMFESRDPRCVYYFSPVAAIIGAGLISDYSGVECSAPSESEVTGLVGHDDKTFIPFARH
jgi:hypothetical protein